VVDEAVIDDKGRVAIPKRLREGLDLREGTKVKLLVEEGKIVIMKPVTPPKNLSAKWKDSSRKVPPFKKQTL